MAWRRRGFRLSWSRKSRHAQGRPSLSKEVIELIRELSLTAPRWGAPRIHGELWKLEFDLAGSAAGNCMVSWRRSPSQTWRTFPANHAKTAVPSDFFVVPIVFLKVLFVLVILSHDRRRSVHVPATAHPSAAWIAHQLFDAFPMGAIPQLHGLHHRDERIAA